MKILIFSDSHLTHRFEPSKYKLLERIISEADKVILNGDIWDGYLTSFGRFVESRWKGLFQLLKSKQVVYLYGNHDSQDLSDGRVNLFSVYHGDRYSFRSGKINFKVEHGHNIYKLPDKDLPLFLVRIATRIYNFQKHNQFIFQREKLLEFFRNLNNIYKKAETKKGEFLITGHSHGAEISLKDNFANSGFIQWGLASYLIVEEGKISLRVEEY